MVMTFQNNIYGKRSGFLIYMLNVCVPSRVKIPQKVEWVPNFLGSVQVWEREPGNMAFWFSLWACLALGQDAGGINGKVGQDAIGTGTLEA